MMKSLLLLGVVFFGAEAESQEIQKLLAFARQLNQTLGSLAGRAAQTRRLQSFATLIPMPAGCPAACDGIQCAYDDSAAILNDLSNAGSDPMLLMNASGDLVGSVCLHRTAMTCAASSTECAGVVDGSSLDLAPCFCDACPNFPKIYEGMGSLVTALATMGSGSTPSAEQLESLMTALCPMSSVLECLGANSACSSALASMGSLGSSLNELATMQSQCGVAGKPTSYATTYNFTSPTCSAEETDGADGSAEETDGADGSAEETDGSDGLLQLSLLAGSFSLLSILN